MLKPGLPMMIWNLMEVLSFGCTLPRESPTSCTPLPRSSIFPHCVFHIIGPISAVCSIFKCLCIDWHRRKLELRSARGPDFFPNSAYESHCICCPAACKVMSKTLMFHSKMGLSNRGTGSEDIALA